MNMQSLKYLRLFIIAVIVLSFAYSPGYAQEKEKNWDFLLVPAYLWIPGFSGDIAIKGDESSGDVSIMEAFEFGYLIHAEAMRNRRWGMLVDALYVRLGKDDAKVGEIDAEFEFQTWLVDFGGTYRFYETAFGESGNSRNLALEVLAGARYASVDQEFKFGDGLQTSGHRQFIDPIIGGRFLADLPWNLSCALKADVGGGVNIDLTWSLTGSLTYNFNRLFSVWAGYRAMVIDFEDGGIQDKFKFKMTMHGPVLGLGFRF
ncbi:MAG: hypothetical protein GY801_11515 [bacterium]|nr:hypothetical protein [bacterium]